VPPKPRPVAYYEAIAARIPWKGTFRAKDIGVRGGTMPMLVEYGYIEKVEKSGKTWRYRRVK
jgi:hypothetical protein